MENLRLDKWLWAARFFKTRSMCTEAIAGGRVHIDGQRVKPGRKIAIGMSVSVTLGQIEKTVIIKALHDRRASATIAQSLYEETEESLAKLEAHKALMKSAPEVDRALGRPNKKDRRDMRKFKQSFE